MIDLLLSIIIPDGTLTVTRTDDCYLLATYENRFAGGPDMQEYNVDGNSVTVIKGGGDDPEKLVVFALGKEYSVEIEENDTGTVCVPYYEGS